jgi:large subunit ribosomal protein L25
MTTTLKVQKRERLGTGGARELRRAGQTPAVIYNNKGDSHSVFIDTHELNILYKAGHFTSKLLDVELDGKTLKVIPKEIQKHPVSDAILHADFLSLEGQDQIKVAVKVTFINAEKSPGLKRGGVLNVVRRDVELLCSSTAIPEKLVVDLETVQIGDSIHISDITVPEGATPTITDRDFTIATVVGRVLKTESASEKEGEEGAEGEAEAGSEETAEAGAENAS